MAAILGSIQLPHFLLVILESLFSLKYNDLIDLAIIVKYVCRCITGSMELPMRPDVVRAITFVQFRIQPTISSTSKHHSFQTSVKGLTLS